MKYTILLLVMMMHSSCKTSNEHTESSTKSSGDWILGKEAQVVYEYLEKSELGPDNGYGNHETYTYTARYVDCKYTATNRSGANCRLVDGLRRPDKPDLNVRGKEGIQLIHALGTMFPSSWTNQSKNELSLKFLACSCKLQGECVYQCRDSEYKN